MASVRVKSLICQLDWNIFCTECNPPAPVEVRAGVFYRFHDQELISCPNGHQGTLRDYRRAAACPGEQAGPFVLLQQGDDRVATRDDPA